MKIYSLLTVVLLFLLAPAFIQAQNADVRAIHMVMDKQVAAWNNGDITAYMEGYWKSDSLMFVGKSGITYGWQPTLQNYKKGYPDTATMGKLAFTILQVKKLSADACFVVGKWQLARSMGDIGGHYTLLFRKIKGRWVIVADHSS
jgi:ketosteroid isomerase-like protein